AAANRANAGAAAPAPTSWRNRRRGSFTMSELERISATFVQRHCRGPRLTPQDGTTQECALIRRLEGNLANAPMQRSHPEISLQHMQVARPIKIILPNPIVLGPVGRQMGELLVKGSLAVSKILYEPDGRHVDMLRVIKESDGVPAL